MAFVCFEVVVTDKIALYDALLPDLLSDSSLHIEDLTHIFALP